MEEIKLAGITHRGRVVPAKQVLPATEKQREYIHSLCQEIKDILKFFVVEKQNKYAAWPWPPDAWEWPDDGIAGIPIDAPELPKYYAGGIIRGLQEKLHYLRRKKKEYEGSKILP